ncbi:MAG TPA: helix-turn-helix transcriptional regulator [Dehalococcoidia bacterium]|nr:helix-turn-helix transcriptional regulator [Dehalococcoidia bacterium]
MTSSTALVTTNLNEEKDDYIDAFSDIDQADPFELKKDYVATQLAALMSFCKKSRSDVAKDLGWKKSRVTRVLSGRENLTIKSIWEFTAYLGFEFDVAFRRPDELRAKQPWQTAREVSVPIPAVNWQIQTSNLSREVTMEIQTAKDVVNDLIHGEVKDYYVSFVRNDPKTTYLTDMSAQITNFIPTRLKLPVMRIEDY